MKKKPYISIVDYKMGNLESIKRSLSLLDFNSHVINTPNQVKKSEFLLLPGVGSFRKAMDNLKKMDLTDSIISKSNSGIPTIGVCLGMQLFFDLPPSPSHDLTAYAPDLPRC